jgi:hypothetical protein
MLGKRINWVFDPKFSIQHDKYKYCVDKLQATADDAAVRYFKQQHNAKYSEVMSELRQKRAATINFENVKERFLTYPSRKLEVAETSYTEEVASEVERIKTCLHSGFENRPVLEDFTENCVHLVRTLETNICASPKFEEVLSFVEKCSTDKKTIEDFDKSLALANKGQSCALDPAIHLECKKYLATLADNLSTVIDYDLLDSITELLYAAHTEEKLALLCFQPLLMGFLGFVDSAPVLFSLYNAGYFKYFMVELHFRMISMYLDFAWLEDKTRPLPRPTPQGCVALVLTGAVPNALPQEGAGSFWSTRYTSEKTFPLALKSGFFFDFQALKFKES